MMLQDFNKNQHKSGHQNTSKGARTALWDVQYVYLRIT